MFLSCPHLVLAWEDSLMGITSSSSPSSGFKNHCFLQGAPVFSSGLLNLASCCLSILGLFFFLLFKKRYVGTMNDFFNVLDFFSCPWHPAEVRPSHLGADWCPGGDGEWTPFRKYSQGECFPDGSFCFPMSWCKPITSGTFVLMLVFFMLSVIGTGRQYLPRWWFNSNFTEYGGAFIIKATQTGWLEINVVGE